MKEIRVRNLKSINDSGVVEIKPITILVGENSAGKSSLIRLFPLFKQSSELKTLGTVLWSGKFVDYGSFNESINKSALIANPKEEIIFNFSYQVFPNYWRDEYSAYNVDLEIQLHGNEYEKGNYSNFIYRVHDSIFSLKIDSENKLLNFSLNDEDVTKFILDCFIVRKRYGIIPELDIINRTRVFTVYETIVNELKDYLHHKTSPEKLQKIAKSLKFGTLAEVKKALSNKNIVGKIGAERLSVLDENSELFRIIRDHLLLIELDDLTEEISDAFSSIFNNSVYVTPLRAAADRYYRIQNTSIREIDPDGSNLAMYLFAMKKEELSSLNEWLFSEIDLKVRIHSENGHASIVILNEINGVETNIADNGFGLSQVLPVLIQVWVNSRSSTKRNRYHKIYKTVVIEQPELHLHPKMQSKLGSTFAKAINLAKKHGLDLRIFIETHSREIINSIGNSIDKSVISHDDVAVYLTAKNDSTNIKRSYFDEGGFLQKWPYGFFDGE